MPDIARREVLAGVAAITLGGLATPLWAQSRKRSKLGTRLRIVIPAVSRSSLDNAGRALGDALVGAGLCDEIEYENKDGTGGTAGLAYFAEKYNSDPNALFMGDTTLVGALALQKSRVDLGQVQPVARLISDYLVVVVAGNAPIKTVPALAQRLLTNPKQTTLAIGAPGGAEHVFAGLLYKAAKGQPEEAQYVGFARNFEMVDAVVSGRVAVGIGAYTAFRDEFSSGKLRALGVSSARAAYGLRSIREQGLDADLTNWRAVFTGQSVKVSRQAEMVQAIKHAMGDDEWKKTLQQNYWEASWLSDQTLARSLDYDIKTAQLMIQLLKLKA